MSKEGYFLGGNVELMYKNYIKKNCMYLKAVLFTKLRKSRVSDTVLLLPYICHTSWQMLLSKNCSVLSIPLS